jgi:hypothetical protein
MKITKIIILVICFFNLSYSQKSDIGNWLVYFGNQKIDSKWNWHNEIQLRNYNFIGDINQLLLRTGIGYDLSTNNNNILLGYALINSQKYVAYSSNKIHSNEHRIFQQFITKQQFNRFFIQHRYRIEERFLENNFQLRFRYFLGINIPINKKILEKNSFYIASYNELFINSESAIFDRNRIYGALGFVINKNIKIEAGYMTQTLEKSNYNQFQIVIFNNLPL